MSKTIKVDFDEWNRLNRLRYAVEAMQGHTFYCQDDEGVLRRWYPPNVPSQEGDSVLDRRNQPGNGRVASTVQDRSQ